jgi:hypothetical protein
MPDSEARFTIGTLVTVTVQFTNDAGLPADPSAITFLQRDPTGAVVTMDESDATNPAVGTWVWTASRPFDLPGTWRWRAVGTAGVVAAVERTASVAKSLFA